MNAILLFLSKDRISEKLEYEYKPGVYYSGRQTNDAPVRCLLDQAMRDKNPIRRILAIVTDEVKGDKTADGLTTLERFEKEVKKASKEYGYKSCPEVIAIDYLRPSDASDGGNALRIYNEIYEGIIGENNIAKTEKQHHVYIDYTGGFRDISFLMTTIIRYLEIEGIQCSRILYSNKNEKKIADIGYIYQMFQRVNAVNDFARTGNADEWEKIDTISSPVIREIIDAIQNFSDKVMMCNTSEIESAINRLTAAVNRKISDTGFDEGLFQTLIPLIKRKMYLENGKMEYPDLIQWCLDSRLIQQAVTYYVEKMPVYYFEKNLVPEEVIREETEDYTDVFYRKLFDMAAADTKMENFRQQISEIREKLQDEESLSAKRRLGLRLLKEKADTDEELKDAWIRLRKYTGELYSRRDGKLITDAADLHPVNGEIIKEKDIQKFFNALIINRGRLHFFLYDRLCSGNDDRSDTYIKKTKAIEKLRNGEFQFQTHPEIADKMEIYLAVKLLRNHMNHASGGTAGDNRGEEYAIDYLNKHLETDDLDHDLDLRNPSVNDIIAILKKGISLDSERV